MPTMTLAKSTRKQSSAGDGVRELRQESPPKGSLLESPAMKPPVFPEWAESPQKVSLQMDSLRSRSLLNRLLQMGQL
jgi:hypothetical protein